MRGECAKSSEARRALMICLRCGSRKGVSNAASERSRALEGKAANTDGVPSRNAEPKCTNYLNVEVRRKRPENRLITSENGELRREIDE